jgi:hypothetical protein
MWLIILLNLIVAGLCIFTVDNKRLNDFMLAISFTLFITDLVLM